MRSCRAKASGGRVRRVFQTHLRPNRPGSARKARPRAGSHGTRQRAGRCVGPVFGRCPPKRQGLGRTGDAAGELFMKTALAPPRPPDGEGDHPGARRGANYGGCPRAGRWRRQGCAGEALIDTPASPAAPRAASRGVQLSALAPIGALVAQHAARRPQGLRARREEVLRTASAKRERATRREMGAKTVHASAPW